VHCTICGATWRRREVRNRGLSPHQLSLGEKRRGIGEGAFAGITMEDYNC